MNFNVGITLECNIFSGENILDKLLSETKEAFRDGGIPHFVAFFVSQLDAAICAKLRQSSEWGELHEKCLGKCCCGTPRLERVRVEQKKIATTIGKVVLDWIRMRCKICGQSFIPMRAVLGMEKYQGESQEFIKLACETVVEQSYRRSKRHLSEIGGIKITHTKLHRMVMNSDCDEISLSLRGANLKYLIADGTGFPEFLPAKRTQTEGKQRKSEIKTVIGIDDKNRMIPIGVWSKQSWFAVSREIFTQIGG